ncbi:MAG TPA: hypothetical protein VHN99_07945 [Deinococcales bacterium]|nr:hypothetical protein [Deinococcales bacterium]
MTPRKFKPDLIPRLMAMIARHEGGWDALAGDFDGQGLSFGPLQWNLGQGTLVPVLRNAINRDPAGVAAIMGQAFIGACRSTGTLAAHLKAGKGPPASAWKRLAALPAMRQAFQDGAAPYLTRANAACNHLALWSERAAALCLDICVQQGDVRADIRAEYKRLGGPRLPEEWQRLKALAVAAANSANPRWREDVLARKLTCALGAGIVHGRDEILDRDFGLVYTRTWFEGGN